jgi:hypothetical protein
MTEDYTLRDIEAFLKRQGVGTGTDAISVVLTRLKGRGDIEEVRSGGGRKATVYRKPVIVTPEAVQTGGPASDAGNEMKETTGK